LRRAQLGLRLAPRRAVDAVRPLRRPSVTRRCGDYG
jgi:hypothetical protein